MKDKILKIQHLFKRIYYDFIYDYNDWKENLWDRDLDENDCCDGRECGCDGRTVRQNYIKDYPYAQY